MGSIVTLLAYWTRDTLRNEMGSLQHQPQTLNVAAVSVLGKKGEKRLKLAEHLLCRWFFGWFEATYCKTEATANKSTTGATHRDLLTCNSFLQR